MQNTNFKVACWGMIGERSFVSHQRDNLDIFSQSQLEEKESELVYESFDFFSMTSRHSCKFT